MAKYDPQVIGVRLVASDIFQLGQVSTKPQAIEPIPRPSSKSISEAIQYLRRVATNGVGWTMQAGTDCRPSLAGGRSGDVMEAGGRVSIIVTIMVKPWLVG